MKQLGFKLDVNNEKCVENAKVIQTFSEEVKKRGWGYMENGILYYEESKESEVNELLEKYIKP